MVKSDVVFLLVVCQSHHREQILWDYVSRITTLGLDLQNSYIRVSSPVGLLWDWVSRTTTLSLALQNSYIRFSAEARHIQIDQGTTPTTATNHGTARQIQR
jgi:hypothetical protein